MKNVVCMITITFFSPTMRQVAVNVGQMFLVSEGHMLEQSVTASCWTERGQGLSTEPYLQHAWTSLHKSCQTNKITQIVIFMLASSGKSCLNQQMMLCIITGECA